MILSFFFDVLELRIQTSASSLLAECEIIDLCERLEGHFVARFDAARGVAYATRRSCLFLFRIVANVGRPEQRQNPLRVKI